VLSVLSVVSFVFLDLTFAAAFLGCQAAAGVLTVMGPEILGRLIDQHGAALVLYARQWCAAPEDVVQEAFIKLSREKTPPLNAAGWLYRVVRNAAISAGRASRRRQEHEAAASHRPEAWFVAEESALLDATDAAAAIEKLPAEQREVIVAHLWGGLSFEQIAELMNCSSSSAHRWYAAGLAALRERFQVPCPKKS
jgi:RNA polymerase sigma factor (sigma-70 family)